MKFGTAKTIGVGYETSDGTATAPDDYTAVSGTLTFTPGLTRRAFSVAIKPDELDEGDETVNLTLSSPSNAISGTPFTATLTIAEDVFKVYLPLILRNE